MPQSAIGPGIAIFSRYFSVLETDDKAMSVKTALQLINAELDEFLNNLHGDLDPETRFTGSWFEQNGYEKGDFGAANSLATARGISVESVKNSGIIESSAGKVRILQRDELDPNWDPNSDSHLTIWECCQYLVRDYEEGGDIAAAMLVKKMGFEKADAVKDLAYYLYDICSNKRQDAKEAKSYNALIAGWNDIMRMANSIHDTHPARQASLF
jgi:putative DNA methylase